MCSLCLKQKEYRKDLGTEILGKGMELNSDILEIQRAKRASEITSQVGTHTPTLSHLADALIQSDLQ